MVEIAELGGQRMQDHGSRLVGLDGMAVRGVDEVGDQLDLEVELIARAGCCPGCGRGSLTIKDRPVVRVRDLPVAGRPTYLVWRKRRFGCRACGRTFTETHPELPARQRVTARFCRRLTERVRGGAAHAEVAREERTTRYQVACAFADRTRRREAHDVGRAPRRLSLDEAHHRRSHDLATVVCDLDRRCVIEVLDGRDRRTIERWLSALAGEIRAVDHGGLDRPLRRLPPGDPRRERQRQAKAR
ncbi:MAG TPA: transposase family protein, partial [Thermoleophilaceae bacterium]|nr:transposase family protein [Thermoleophilaceae bacterium]